MPWDIRSTYYYLVCFATLLMIVIGSVQVVRNTMDLVLPPVHYVPSPMDMAMRYRTGPDDTTPEYTREELERMAEEEQQRMAAMERRNALRGLLGSLALVFIAAPVYAYHWRQIRPGRTPA